jgi:hypothetical protein
MSCPEGCRFNELSKCLLHFRVIKKSAKQSDGGNEANEVGSLNFGS